MADFISFNEGQDVLANTGLPATCSFDLSTKSVDATSPFVETDTYASRGVITGTGYAAQTESEPTSSGGTVSFAQKSWSTGSATDWSSTARSCVLHDGSKIICAWNLQAGGAARDLSAANTTENVTPKLIVGG